MITIIICTYNRPVKVVELINLLFSQSINPAEIIVVDSSDSVNDGLNSYAQIRYIRSSHKNQPYQRYLGYLAANNEWLLFLDDDMEPVNDEVLRDLHDIIIRKPEAVAFSLRFENLHEDTALSKQPLSKINWKNRRIEKFVRWLTVYPVMPKGKVGWNGVRGQHPKGGYTEWLSGGSFVVSKKVMFKNFNFRLFDIFDNQLGMGEDLLIGQTISEYGKIWATKEVYFYHNDQQDSTYSIDTLSYNRKVIYSRMFLSLEKARLEGKSFLLALVHYIYYSLWRFLGLLINIIIDPSKKRIYTIRGFLQGFIRSFELLQNKSISASQCYWQNRALKDFK